MSLENVIRFARVIMENDEIRERLLAVEDRESLVNLAIELGEENGYSFSADDVNRYLEVANEGQETTDPVARMEGIPAMVLWN